MKMDALYVRTKDGGFMLFNDKLPESFGHVTLMSDNVVEYGEVDTGPWACYSGKHKDENGDPKVDVDSTWLMRRMLMV